MDKFEKQPSEILDFDCSFSGEGLDDGDYPAAVVSVTANNPAIVIDSYTLNPVTHVLKVWLSAGVSGKTYKVTAVVDTHLSRRLEGDFKVKVKER